MPMTEAIQTLIHKLEIGASSRLLRVVALCLTVVALALLYDLRAYRNLATPEAMDSAQLARNLAEGKGYTTLFIRPFSVYLLQKAYTESHGPAPLGDRTDSRRIKGPHPDLANPPVYPLLLAGVMKVAPPFRYQAAGTGTINLGVKKVSVWNNAGGFWFYAPDILIDFLNQILFIAGT